MRRLSTPRWIRLIAKVTLGLLLSAHVAIAAQGCIAHGWAPFAVQAGSDSEVRECHGPFSKERELCLGRCIQLQHAVGIVNDYTDVAPPMEAAVVQMPVLDYSGDTTEIGRAHV